MSRTWTRFMYADSSIAAGAGGNGLIAGTAWSIEQAFTSAVAGDWVWMKGDGIFDASATPMDIANTGSTTADTHIMFCGYYLTKSDGDLLSDMDRDETYYGGAYNAMLQDVGETLWNANAKWVEIDGEQTLADDLLTIDNKDNIHFRNLYFRGTTGAAGKNVIQYASSLTQGCSFTNCRFDEGSELMSGTSLSCRYRDCFFGPDVTDRAIFSFGADNVYTECIFLTAPGNYAALSYQNIFSFCIFINGSFAIKPYDKLTVVHNCLFYYFNPGPIVAIADFGAAADPILIEYNNIYYMQDAATDYAVSIASGKGCVAYSDYSLTVSLYDSFTEDGINPPFWHADSGSFIGEHAIPLLNQDPKFADIANYDFRLLPGSPCLNVGRPDVFGQPTTIGPFHKRQSARPVRGIVHA